MVDRGRVVLQRLSAGVRLRRTGPKKFEFVFAWVNNFSNQWRTSPLLESFRLCQEPRRLDSRCIWCPNYVTRPMAMRPHGSSRARMEPLPAVGLPYLADVAARFGVPRVPFLEAQMTGLLGEVVIAADRALGGARHRAG